MAQKNQGWTIVRDKKKDKRLLKSGSKRYGNGRFENVEIATTNLIFNIQGGLGKEDLSFYETELLQKKFGENWRNICFKC